MEEDQDDELTTEMKAVLDERLKESKEDYLTADGFVEQLNKKHGL
jgi:hypothetical protein